MCFGRKNERFRGVCRRGYRVISWSVFRQGKVCPGWEKMECGWRSREKLFVDRLREERVGYWMAI